MKFSIFFMISVTLVSANTVRGWTVMRDVPAHGKPELGHHVQQYGGLLSNVVARVLEVDGADGEQKKSDGEKRGSDEQLPSTPKKRPDNANEANNAPAQHSGDIEDIFMLAKKQFQKTVDSLSQCFEKFLESFDYDLGDDDEDFEGENVDTVANSHKQPQKNTDVVTANVADVQKQPQSGIVNDKDAASQNAAAAGNSAVGADKPKSVEAPPAAPADAKQEMATKVVKETAENVNKTAATDKATAPGAGAAAPAPAKVAKK